MFGVVPRYKLHSMMHVLTTLVSQGFCDAMLATQVDAEDDVPTDSTLHACFTSQRYHVQAAQQL